MLKKQLINLDRFYVVLTGALYFFWLTASFQTRPFFHSLKKKSHLRLDIGQFL